MIAGDHGPDKRYNKFRVIKNSNRYELDYEREFYFVLRPETNDEAAIAALEIYAHMCRDSYPGLADDIERELERIDRGESLDPDRPLPKTVEGWKEEMK
jgi:hypothetical protein